MRVLAFSGGKDSMACLHLLRASLDCAIYVDTGFAYPETLNLLKYARTMLPVHAVNSDRRGQNKKFGLPADLVPINWTYLGQMMTNEKPVMVQSYLDCCYQNIARPLLDFAKEKGATEIVYGQRSDENHTATSRDGDIVEGIKRLHPIESWTEQMVLDYLRTKMTLPEHYAIKHSSLDCYDCTAFKSDSMDRVEWTKARHPAMYADYAKRAAALKDALKEAIKD